MKEAVRIQIEDLSQDEEINALRQEMRASQEELQAYANKRRNESLLATRTITFYTLTEPGHGVGDILALTHDEIGGIYLETGWSVTMQPGSLMTHSAKRTVIA